MKQFLADPSGCAYPGSPVLAALIEGWGNPVWSALDEYLAACAHHVLEVRGSILECGSGLSTLLVGAVAKRRGLGHWSLEDSPRWADKTKIMLKRYNCGSVLPEPKPLRNYGDFNWYDPPLELMPENFALVICDGPPSGNKGGRYGLVPIMKRRLAPGCIILLDDGWREEESAVAERWQAELGAEYEMCGTSKPYIRVTLPERNT